MQAYVITSASSFSFARSDVARCGLMVDGFERRLPWKQLLEGLLGKEDAIVSTRHFYVASAGRRDCGFAACWTTSRTRGEDVH